MRAREPGRYGERGGRRAAASRGWIAPRGGCLGGPRRSLLAPAFTFTRTLAWVRLCARVRARVRVGAQVDGTDVEWVVGRVLSLAFARRYGPPLARDLPLPAVDVDAAGSLVRGRAGSCAHRHRHLTRRHSARARAREDIDCGGQRIETGRAYRDGEGI